MSESPDVATKLGAARTRLILEKPFIGALVMHLPLVAADPAWCETIATDGRAFYFNPAYIGELDFAQTQFVLAHEAMHCALGHFARRNHRSPRRWDIAADYAVNLLLIDDGLKPPHGALLNAEFRGLSVEEIYPLIPPDSVEGTLDRHVFNEAAAAHAGGTVARGSTREQNESDPRSGSGTARTGPGDTWDDAGDERRSHSGSGNTMPPELSASEREALARKWQSRMAAAAQHARRAGRLGEASLRRIDSWLAPRLPWRQLLARYMASLARDDYSFQRLSRREGDALLPRLASEQVDLYIVLDTSASIGNEELAEFAAEVDALKGQIRARVTLQACDESLDSRGPWVYQTWQPFALPDGLRGGGGTSFVPAFQWAAEKHIRPDLMLYFTDAEGEFPARAPEYPVVWLVKGKGRVPWGERIQLN
ncbi:MAG TPA: VWA-like domain-containing protein [Burkholderiales bacterium]|nr:VWA-like domain-containing protein [Burkholderiales bacterium]